jgi:hypothetical protein
MLSADQSPENEPVMGSLFDDTSDADIRTFVSEAYETAAKMLSELNTLKPAELATIRNRLPGVLERMYWATRYRRTNWEPTGVRNLRRRPTSKA